MPKLGRTTPCAACPWLRKSPRGYLGADTPVHFYRVSVAQEQEMPCHMQIDYNDPNWMGRQLPDVDLCAGGLIYFKNFCKLPRGRKLSAAINAVKQSVHVFSRPEEFFAWHSYATDDAVAADLAKRASWPCADNDEDDDLPGGTP